MSDDAIRQEQDALKARTARRGWATFDEATQRMRLQRQRQQLADEESERWSESRTSRHVAAVAARGVDGE